ncbi:MAG: hypothetical protein BWX79_03380 [Alphaproteobacteria bacterium ADurb.Bin100]|nr:MAG: hypothetical protein BWX79_03380 [Alphaproteobacteria bacterium ADurb.Bin100]
MPSMSPALSVPLPVSTTALAPCAALAAVAEARVPRTDGRAKCHSAT